MEQEDYAPGEEIIVEGSRNNKIRFILEGRVAVIKALDPSRHAKGGELTLSEFTEGDAFGEMEVLDVMPSAATIKAVTPTKVMSISNKALHEIYKADLTTFALMIMNLARDLSRRLRKMDDKIAKESPLMDWN